MSLADDSDYLEHRAEAELELAQHATDPRAVQAHYQLANAYLDRIHGGGHGEPHPQSSGDDSAP